MRKITFFIAAVLLVSCGEEKKILLPKADVTLVKQVDDLSTIDMFFKVENNDTVADVNKSTVISTTNWVFNIDKRLPLKAILPDIIKLQEKKRKKSKGKPRPPRIIFPMQTVSGRIWLLSVLPIRSINLSNQKTELFCLLIKRTVFL